MAHRVFLGIYFATINQPVILSGVKRSRSFAERSEWSKTKERSDAGISFDFSVSLLIVSNISNRTVSH